ncbi:FAR1-related sequence 5-like protein [Tanacetum coccineum]
MVFHNEDGNPARANIKQALGSYERPHKGVKASANSDIMYFFTSARDGDPLQDDDIPQPLSPMLLRNREARVDYLKYTQEHADALREIVEHDRSLRPSDSDLDSAYLYIDTVRWWSICAAGQIDRNTTIDGSSAGMAGNEYERVLDIVAVRVKVEGIDAYEKESDETQDVKKLDALRTAESFVTHSNFDTPGGTIYYIPKVSVDVLLVKGTLYDSVDDCIVAYIKYAVEAAFVVRQSCQKRFRNGDVKQKCKARAVFNLVPGSKKFVLNVFDTIHNYELKREEFKHLSKRERQLTYWSKFYFGFKNFFKSVNCYIGDSDAQMLTSKIENRNKHVSYFSFDYLVENVKLSAIFWVDEVSKSNYREFYDVVSFDATFKTNKHKMVFVLFTAIDNHRKYVMVAAGLL